MNESETEYLDTAEGVADLVSTWSRLVTAAFREKYGVRAGRDLQSQTDSLRLTLVETLEQSHRVILRGATLTSVDGVPVALIDAVNEIEAGVESTEGDADAN